VDYGDCFYAAIPWNNLPDNKKVFIGWLVPDQQKTYPWMGQMSSPRDLSLRETAKGIRLVQLPSSLIKNNLTRYSKKNMMERKEKLRQTIDLTENPGHISLEILFDKSSLEIFLNKGEKVLSTHIFPDEGANSLSAFAHKGSATFKSLKIWDMSKVNNNQAEKA